MTEFKHGVYRHWKGDMYRTLFIVHDSNNDRNHEPSVVYVSLTDDPLHAGQLNVRHVREFLELLQSEPASLRLRRFEYLGETKP